MLPIIYLYFNDINLVGAYIKWVPIFSILIEISAYEWIKISLLKASVNKSEIVLRGGVTNFSYLLNFSILLYFIDVIGIVLICTCLLFPIMAQHCIDLKSLLERIDGQEKKFHKRIIIKSILFDISLPIVVTVLIYFERISWGFYLVCIVFLFLIMKTISEYFKIFIKGDNSKLQESLINIYFYSFFKRLDGQSLRLIMSYFLTEKVLGQLLPIIIFSRGLNVVGNFTNYLFLHKNKIITLKYFKSELIVPATVVLPLLLSFLILLVFELIGEYGFNFYYAALLISINISAVIKLFLRGVRLAEGSVRDVFNTLILNVILKSIFFIPAFYFDSKFAIVALIYISLEIAYEANIAKKACLENESFKN